MGPHPLWGSAGAKVVKVSWDHTHWGVLFENSKQLTGGVYLATGGVYLACLFMNAMSLDIMLF